jgi:hypothetical protein
MERTAKRLAEEAGDRAAGRVAERSAERLFEGAGERATERAAERAAKRLAEEAGERAAGRFAERSAERLFEEAGEHLTERAAERAAKRLAEEAGERAAGRIAERSAERLAEEAGEHAAGRFAERAAKRLVEEAGEKVLDKSGERGTKIFAERIIQSIEKSGAAAEHFPGKKAIEVVSERLTMGTRGTQQAAKVAERKGKTLIERRLQAFLSAERTILVLRRVGRGALIAVPVLGGLFATYLFKSDVARMKEEKLRRKQEGGPLVVWLIFGGAAFADGLDALCHFAIALSVLLDALSHHHMFVLEQISWGCAIGSTACAVGGEILSHGLRRPAKANNSGAGEDNSKAT